MARWTVAAAIGLGLIIASCTSDDPVDLDNSGAAPTSASSTTASRVEPSTTTAEPAIDLPLVFVAPDPALTGADLDAFFEGQAFFNEVWTAVGPTETATDGLGPLFNADSCVACHASTGRRQVPPEGALVDPGLVIRLSVAGAAPTGAPLPEPSYGHQLQDKAIGAGPAEGTAFTNYVIQRGSYPDGTEFEIIWPTVNIRDRQHGPISVGTLVSARIGPQMIGMGLLEAIPQDAILALADPNDADGDGISGRPNVVWNPITEELELGRFGWKSNIASLPHQIAAAFNGDIGITSSIVPTENCAPGQSVCDETSSGGTNEVSDERIEGLTTYLRGLAVPPQRTPDDPTVVAGGENFRTFGCASCHIESFSTGVSEMNALTGRVVSPYTDLLLHDMGFDMGDDRPDFVATGNEWRTAPLWGLGLLPGEGDRGLLHDGRARTIEEAILWHGGEAARSRANFMGATAEDRTELVTFLESL
ncbi:MAG: di-heme oxidoredictase family protein [Acidimicrobiales bacterium]